MKIVKKFLFTIFLLASGTANNVFAQSGSSGAFAFLNLAVPSRLAAYGGVPVSVFDKDINLALYVPSLINEDIHNHLSFHFTDYFSDIHAGYAAYSATFPKAGSFTAGLQYLNYGTFTSTDFVGNVNGEFSAADYAFQLGWGRKLHPFFSMGANAKFIFSQLESYSSNALAVDLSASYLSKGKLTSASLILRNAGRQLKPYIENSREPLPTELLFSFTHKLAKAPLRLLFTATHLEKWDLTFTDPSQPILTVDPLTGEKLPDRSFAKFADKLARHLVFGGSFAPGDAFQINLSYNYLRRQEMKLESRTALVGFSWGLGIKVKMFRINYARASHHLAGATNHFTLTTSLDQWKNTDKN